jgi:DNA-binding sugar fermentation-stimulating protein
MYQLTQLTYGKIIKRPSASCKTPYVADVTINGQESSVLAHTPALGCCGLSDKDSHVFMTQATSKNICSYKVQLASLYEPKIGKNILIGINPKLAEELVMSSLQQNLLGFLKDLKSFQREKKIENTNSRFDFVGIDVDDRPFVMEVKCVPLADYVDCTAKDRKAYSDESFENVPYNQKIAYFPDGYRKKAKDPVSPRALKHLNDLMMLSNEGTYRTIMCYVIQREDVSSFQPSVIDEAYRNMFYKAQEAGVEMHAIQFVWNEDGSVKLINDDLIINSL